MDAKSFGSTDLTVGWGKRQASTTIWAYNPLVVTPSKVLLSPRTTYRLSYSGGPVAHPKMVKAHYTTVVNQGAVFAASVTNSTHMHIQAHTVLKCAIGTLTVGNHELDTSTQAVHASAEFEICVSAPVRVQLVLLDAVNDAACYHAKHNAMAAVDSNPTFKAIPFGTDQIEFHNYR